MLSQVYRRLCCEVRPIYPEPYSFSFHQRSHQTNGLLFQSNEIKTTKYNVLNFFPKSIITQYQRMANLYFLIVAIISTIPDVSPLNPGLIWAPLVFVLLISIIKELYEDYQRYSTDKEVNNSSEVTVLRQGIQQTVKWKDVVVGDLCYIQDEQSFPADLILISSSDLDGLAFIETSSLDGEQTSKIRYAFPQLNKHYRQTQLKNFRGYFNGDIPSPSFTQFRGTLQIEGHRYGMNDCNQLLFRGAKLRNTQWIWGLAVYTGQCTKIMMNGQSFVTKFSTLEKKLNYLLVSMLILQIGGCLLLAGLATNRNMESSVYLIWPIGYSKSKTFIMNFLMFFVQFSSCIPVSLIVTIEIAKTAQSYFIDFDQLMYSTWRKRKVYARIAALNEELGQVEYVFCDKTGTLTKNELTFHTAVIGNQFYQFEYHSNNKEYICESFRRDLDKKFNGNSLQDQARQGQHMNLMEDYLMCLLLCNSITTIQKQEEITYQSESPDELALIQMAKSMGFVLRKRDKDSVFVNIQGKEHRLEIVVRFPFTSERKRMSVIAKLGEDYILFAKGADNIIIQKANRSIHNIHQSIDQLSRDGLRILLVSKRILPSKDVEAMMWGLKQAGINERELIMEDYSNQFENQLSILGATGLMDELQEGVPSTLKDLQRAGIRTWMLTGDKLQTAMQVAKSCNLIAPDYQIVLMKSSASSIREIIQSSRRRIANSTRKYSLIIEGTVLAKIFNNQEVQKQFAEFTLFFMSIICCRMLPVQKSQAVGIVKRHLEKICLSVGDGGNDVSMIKQANIGVGIYGEQGMSAVQASDYAIPEFRMLWRLLFVHGRWNYMRISEMVLYFLYKSLIFTVPRFLFAFNNAYSGYSIYDDYYIALYNVVFTALPLLVRALLEQDVNYVTKISQRQIDINDAGNPEWKYLPSGFCINVGLRKLFPKIYYVGQRNQIFNLKQCIAWIAQAIIMGVCIYFIVINALGSVSINQTGINSHLQIISITIFTAVIMVDTIKLCMQVKHWTKLLFFTIICLSIAPYVGFMWVVNYYFNRPVGKILIVCFSTAKTYLSVLVLIILLIGINGIFIYTRFHSNRILKRMKIALEEDIQMVDFFSTASEACLSDQERKMNSNLKRSNKIAVTSIDMREDDIVQQ